MLLIKMLVMFVLCYIIYLNKYFLILKNFFSFDALIVFHQYMCFVKQSCPSPFNFPFYKLFQQKCIHHK